MLSPSLRIVLLALTTVMLLASGAVSAEKFHKWTDENGVVHYGEQPPADVQAETVEVQDSVVPAVDIGEPDDGAATESAADMNAQNNQEVAAVENRQQPLTDAQRQQNCTNATQNAATLAQRQRVMVEGEDGNMVRLTDDERLAKLETAQQQMEAFCDNQ